MSDRPGPVERLRGTIPRPTVSYREEDETTGSTLARVTLRAAAPAGPARVKDRGALTVVEGTDLGAIHVLGDTTTIGRGGDCGVRAEAPGVSRQHARIVRQPDGGFVVEDLESRNGTYVNAERVTSHRLVEGDRLSFGSEITLRFGMTDAAEELLLRRLYESSVTDALTGAYNRKHFGERLAGEVAYARRHDAPLSLLMLDIDHFKRVNDTYGHLAGDQALVGLADTLRCALRAEDVLARWGGEEFVIITRGLDLEHATRFAERIRLLVEGTRLDAAGHAIRLTVSIGVASFACLDGTAAVDGLVAVADRRLYAAKAAGRNRTIAG